MVRITTTSTLVDIETILTDLFDRFGYVDARTLVSQLRHVNSPFIGRNRDGDDVLSLKVRAILRDKLGLTYDRADYCWR